jgi:hypothetical protein
MESGLVWQPEIFYADKNTKLYHIPILTPLFSPPMVKRVWIGSLFIFNIDYVCADYISATQITLKASFICIPLPSDN